jgi:hypothetical protein
VWKEFSSELHEGLGQDELRGLEVHLLHAISTRDREREREREIIRLTVNNSLGNYTSYIFIWGDERGECF